LPWRSACVVLLDADGRYRDADASALDLLGVGTVDELRTMSPDAFQPAPASPEDQEAFRAAFVDALFQGLIGEGPIRRTDGELVRVRTAILPEPDGGFRILLYPVERPPTNLEPRIYKIADVLAEWRSAERRLVEVDQGTPEGRQIAADVDLLRSQYQLLFSRRTSPAG
jgi:PAS domain-containing protein